MKESSCGRRNVEAGGTSQEWHCRDIKGMTLSWYERNIVITSNCNQDSIKYCYTCICCAVELSSGIPTHTLVTHDEHATWLHCISESAVETLSTTEQTQRDAHKVRYYIYVLNASTPSRGRRLWITYVFCRHSLIFFSVIKVCIWYSRMIGDFGNSMRIVWLVVSQQLWKC